MTSDVARSLDLILQWRRMDWRVELLQEDGRCAIYLPGNKKSLRTYRILRNCGKCHHVRKRQGAQTRHTVSAFMVVVLVVVVGAKLIFHLP